MAISETIGDGDEVREDFLPRCSCGDGVVVDGMVLSVGACFAAKVKRLRAMIWAIHSGTG